MGPLQEHMSLTVALSLQTQVPHFLSSLAFCVASHIPVFHLSLQKGGEVGQLGFAYLGLLPCMLKMLLSGIPVIFPGFYLLNFHLTG